ncbi:MAG: LysM peptidoglycan-binding domain-containing protein [Lachnospiraceae bacterium]|nr:LysM peptidoglycan-binding domain-containing protein [Lachnospiraceae bacterium]
MEHTILFQRELRRMRNKKRRVARLKRKIMISTMILILVAAFSVTLGSIFVQAKATDQLPSHKYFTSIEVGAGDTLWSIANDNISLTHYASIGDYIDEVLQINNLSGDEINAGQHLIIPYYSS